MIMGVVPTNGRALRGSDHPKDPIRKVLTKLEAEGWTICAEGHWGRLYCPCEPRCTKIPIAGTPKDAERLARRIQRLASRCPLPEGDPRRSL